MRRVTPLLLALALICAVAGGARSASDPGRGGGPSGFEVIPGGGGAAGARGPILALNVAEDGPMAGIFGWHRDRGPALSDSAKAAIADSVEQADRARQPVLNAARVQVVMRSLTVPGWGQATMGHPTSARVFGLIEAGVWTSYVAFRVQQSLRTTSFENTARLFAGIDVGNRDEEFRRIVGQYASSDEYNRLVVFRDAANLYLADPAKLDYDGYHDYIAAHSLRGADTWNWDSGANAVRYRGQRKSSQRAALRANTALALALVNRLVSVLHVARLHQPTVDHPGTWNFEVTPDPGMEPMAFRVGVRTRF
jgi:hypothetical protein